MSFPQADYEGQLHTIGNTEWRWDGEKWVIEGSGTTIKDVYTDEVGLVRDAQFVQDLYAKVLETLATPVLSDQEDVNIAFTEIIDNLKVGGATIIISERPPGTPDAYGNIEGEEPEKGNLWIHEETMSLYVYDGEQWVQIHDSCNGGGGSGGGGVSGDLTQYVKRRGDTISGPITITNPNLLKGDNDLINKEYVDKLESVIQNEIYELEEEIDAIAPSIERGLYEYDTNATLDDAPDFGKFVTLSGDLDNGTASVTDLYDNTTYIVLHNSDSTGNLDNQWTDADPGKLIQLYDRPDPDFILGTILEKDTNRFPGCVTFKIEIVNSSGSPTNNEPFLSRLNIFEPPSGGDASDFVRKRGDIMKGDLEIKPESGKAMITINGHSDDISDPASVLTFKNQSVSGSDKNGLLEFHSNDTSQYFRFDEDVDLGSNGLHSVDHVRFIADGTIQVNKTDKILFRNPQNGNDGNAAVEIQRAPNTRRTFAIRGKKPDDTEGDILSVYANNDGQGGDAINYVGKMVGGSNLINKDYVDYRYGPGRLNVIQHKAKWKGGHDPFSDTNFCTIDADGNATEYRNSIEGIVVYENFGMDNFGGRLTRNLWRTGSYVEIVNPNNGGLWISGKIRSFSRANGTVTIKFDRIWNEPYNFNQNQECNVFITGI